MTDKACVMAVGRPSKPRGQRRLHDLKKIHAADDAALSPEVEISRSTILKQCAASTYNIVQHHPAELTAKPTALK